MYEAEANRRVEGVDQLPREIVDQFRGLREKVTARTVLPWGEHCTECVWPTCYTSCDLYSPREDGKCRRFVDGMVRIDCPGAVNSYVLKIRFKRWGKLWTPGNVHLFPLDETDRVERFDQSIGSILQQLPMPAGPKTFFTSKRYGWKKRMAVNARPSAERPDLFLIECYNPSDQAISVSLTMRPSGQAARIPYQKLISFRPGYCCEAIPVEEIGSVLDLDAPFGIDLTPNDISDDTALFFGVMDFVKGAASAAPSVPRQPKIKCVVWDLDNTLWSGTLIEDGAEKLTLKPGIADVIKELDRRGILQSIASKNNFDDAMAVVKSHLLDEYFLYPQISWGPKGEAVKAIARKLNIGIDTLMLVDDSEFELAEVQSACAGVKVLHAERYRELPQLPECQVPVTAESVERRKMYRQNSVREGAAEAFGADYLGFLRDCRIEIQIEPLSPANFDRVHELTQRTNQMNFSGNRYDRKLLEEISVQENVDTYVIGCRDRFGSYGIVGFAIVDTREPRLTDLMFSCRIQSKRVEHAFLSYLLKKYISATGRDFQADYRMTPRNAPSGRVFQDIGMEQKGERDGVISLVFPRDRDVPDDQILSIIENGHPETRTTHACTPASR